MTEALKKSLKPCAKGDHQLVEIYQSGGEMEEEVVSWCSVCGCVVVDLVSDGRLMGTIMKMKGCARGREIEVKIKESIV